MKYRWSIKNREIMNRKERKQFTQAWLEAENIITMIEPEFVPEKQFRRPEKSGPEEINFLLQFLRLVVRVMLHDKESTERENLTLAKLVDQHVGSNP